MQFWGLSSLGFDSVVSSSSGRYHFLHGCVWPGRVGGNFEVSPLGGVFEAVIEDCSLSPKLGLAACGRGLGDCSFGKPIEAADCSCLSSSCFILGDGSFRDLARVEVFKGAGFRSPFRPSAFAGIGFCDLLWEDAFEAAGRGSLLPMSSISVSVDKIFGDSLGGEVCEAMGRNSLLC